MLGSYIRKGLYGQDVRALRDVGERESERVRREHNIIKFLEAYDLQEAICASTPHLGPRGESWHHSQTLSRLRGNL